MTATCALPAELTIYTVAECHARYLAWLAEPEVADAPDDVLSVDAAAVEEVDAAGVQLLLSLGKTLAARQRRLALVDAGDALRAACTTLGAAHLLGEESSLETAA